jgi:hypothetical protein
VLPVSSTGRCDAGRRPRGPVTEVDRQNGQALSAAQAPPLFGQNRTSVLRMAGLPLQNECEKDWKMHCAQAKEYEKQGRKVPSGFITPQWFFTFQYNRNLLLAAAPLKVHEIEQWAWTFARWAIADASDICKDSEFMQILTKADVVSMQIQDFLRAMTGSGGPTNRRRSRMRSRATLCSSCFASQPSGRDGWHR